MKDARRVLANSEAKAEVAVPSLIQHLSGLKCFAESVPLQIPVKIDDHLGFMALFFNAKQVHHAESIILLADHADTSLIARSMLEGLCLLKWAAQEPERALRWREFSAILDWRTAKWSEEGNREVSADDQQRIDEMMAACTQDFLTEKAKEAKRSGTRLPKDPWVARWYQPQLRQIFEAVGAADLYEGPYFTMSEWHHWSPGGLAHGMRSHGDELGFTPRSKALQCGAVACAFQALAETVSLLIAHLKPEEAENIAQRIFAYVNDPEVKSAFS